MKNEKTSFRATSQKCVVVFSSLSENKIIIKFNYFTKLNFLLSQKSYGYRKYCQFILKSTETNEKNKTSTKPTLEPISKRKWIMRFYYFVWRTSTVSIWFVYVLAIRLHVTANDEKNSVGFVSYRWNKLNWNTKFNWKSVAKGQERKRAEPIFNDIFNENGCMPKMCFNDYII